MSAVRKTIST